MKPASLPEIVAFLVALAVSLAAGAPVPPSPSKPAPTADFARDMAPIFRAKCLACHGAQMQGGLRLDSHAALLKGGAHGPAVVAGKAAESLLVKRVEGTVEPRMPPGGAPLTAAEIR